MANDDTPERQQWDNLVTELDTELVVFGAAGHQLGRILYKIKLHLQAHGLDKARTGRWATILRERQIAESTAKDWVVKYQQAEGIAPDKCFFKSEMTRVKKTRNSHKYSEKNTAVSAALEQTRIACADDRDPDNRHDLYSLRFPRLYGEQIVHCDPLLPSTYFGARLSKKGPLRGNLLDHLAGVTPDFVSSLTVAECKNLIDVYARGFVGLSRMHDAEKAPYAKEALDDLHQSAAQLTAYSPNYGFSRWASLQATEKLLKSFIAVCKQTPRKSHNLADLASTATSLGLPSPSSSLLQDIQCDADVRYSAATVGKAEALRAHYATLSLCSDIASRLQPQSGWGTESRMLSYEVNGTRRPMKALLVRRGKTVVGAP